MIRMVFYHILEGMILLIRACTIIAAGLLIARSIIVRFMPVQARSLVLTLENMTEAFVTPVRVILPEQGCTRNIDYAPLVAAIIILLLGLGFKELLENIEVYCAINR
ncbi:YggT family protein [bacterium]|nr:YggT family protein [bacterium]